MNVAAGLEILELAQCYLAAPPQTVALAFTFLGEEKEEAGPHLILVKFNLDNFLNLNLFWRPLLVSFASMDVTKKEIHRDDFLREEKEVAGSHLIQLVNPGFWFVGVLLLVHFYACALFICSLARR